MTSPAFDFQGDPLQQGGALIIGSGDQCVLNQVIIKNNRYYPKIQVKLVCTV